jgi:hypothetical protein
LGGPLGSVRGGGGGLWYRAGGAPEPLAAYAFKGADSQAVGEVNLVNPGTFDLTGGVAPGWNAADGLVFTAANGEYRNTGIAVATNMTVIIRFHNLSTGISQYIGARTGTIGSAGLMIQPTSSNPNRHIWYYGNVVVKNTVGELTSNVLAIAGSNAYVDGVDDGVTLSQAATAQTIFLGALNNGGSPVGFMDGNIVAAAIYPTSTDHATWVPAVSAETAAL